MAMEDLELAKRKLYSGLIIAVGVILQILGLLHLYIFIGLYGWDWFDANKKIVFLSLFLFLLIGFATVFYGNHHWKKVTHVVWTKQAIREMRDQELRAEDEYYRAKHIGNTNIEQSEKKLELTCSDCGTAINANENFCPNCGSKAQK